KNIDPKLVVNEIRNGRSLESVQKLFGLKFKSEVQDLYLRGLMELGEIPQVEFNRASAPPAPKPLMAAPPPPPPVPERAPVVRRREKPAPVAVMQKPAMLIKTANFRTIGQSGSITLNKALLIEQLGFGIGDSFEICREDDRIILKKIPTPH
ncbi:MAG: hypothetical protein ACLGPL_04170, partial [Acidobacteriota bacterium]